MRISDLQAFYLALMAVFILTGFIYNFLFLGSFNIKVEQFFTLQDYLASSIEKVYLIIVALLFATLSSFVARNLMRERERFAHHRLLVLVLYWIPVVVMATGIIMRLRFGMAAGYFVLSFGVYMSGDYFLFKVIFKGNHESYSRYFYLTVIVFYLLLILSTVVYDHDYVLHKPMHSLKNYLVHFTRNITVNQNDCIVLEANSNYFFFFDKRLNKSFVVPKDGISYIETSM